MRSFPIQSEGLFLFIPLSFWKSFPRTYFQGFYQGNANRSVCLIPLPGSRLNCSDTTIGFLTVSDASTTFLLHFQYLQFTLKRDKGPSPSFIKIERRMASQVSGNKPAISWMCRWCQMPQILNTCEHNREITSYLQFLLQNGIQKLITCTAAGLPCLLFSSFATKHVLVWLVWSCQPPFSIITCFDPTPCCTIFHCVNTQYIPAISCSYSGTLHFMVFTFLYKRFSVIVWSCREVCDLQYTRLWSGGDTRNKIQSAEVPVIARESAPWSPSALLVSYSEDTVFV